MPLPLLAALIPALLSAGVGGAQTIMGMNANKAQQDISWKSLMETKRANRKAEQLATATKTDAYGNKVYYIPGLGWQNDLTPITEAILGGEQREQLLSLTKDMPRQRLAAERQDKRSQLAGDQFEEVFNKYKYRPRSSESGEIQDATQDLMISRRKGLDQASAMLARQLMRTGGSSDLSRIYKMADDAYAGSLQEATLKGKQLGKERFRQYEGADTKAFGDELGMLSNLANSTTSSPMQMSNYAGNMQGQADSGMRDLMNAITGGRDASANAYSNYANSIQAPDLSALQKAIMSIGEAFGSYSKGQEEQQTAEQKRLNYFPPRPAAWDPNAMTGLY